LRDRLTPICRFERRASGTRIVSGCFDRKALLSHPMTCGEPKRQDDCKILQFPLRDAAGRHRARTAKHDRRDMDPLLDLSRYEWPRRHTEDYKSRMVENVAAVILLSALVAVATFDFIDLEKSQHCTYAVVCVP
jgi:hypothetical protein